MSAPKTYVYILKSQSKAARYYTGLTSHVPTRLAAHNAGMCRHTSSGRPWEVDVVIEFSDEARAVKFERYLKSGSGGAFRPANGHALAEILPRPPISRSTAGAG